jgi:ABC-type antimicrobial peptide transport system permease subunit
MEKFFSIFRLGIRYLYRYRRRYFFLSAALIFGFAVVTFITSVKDGMYESVYYSAQSHYAGDIVAIGYEALPGQENFLHRMGQNERAAVLEAAELSGIKARYTVQRTHFGNDAVVHYNGIAVQLKTLVGCDWTQEAHLFGKMFFDEQSEPLAGDDGIVLSVPVARQLGAKTGDSVILEVQTRFGQKNTGPFIVKGIVQDTSIFGYYKAYISRLSLNRLIIYDDDDCSSIGFFFDFPDTAEQKRVQLQDFLFFLNVQTGPLVYDRDGLARERDRPWEGVRVFLYTLPVYLSEISYLLDAMNIVTYFIYGMMLLIILVSAAVTYRLILRERSKEMGVMRVIGFYGADLRMVLWIEIIIIGLFSMVAGFVLARILSWAVSFMSFSWFPGFEIFLNNGRLIALYLPGTMLINIFLILFVLLALALIPSFRVSRKYLPELLSGEL